MMAKTLETLSSMSGAREAVVVFMPEASAWWQRLLRERFRHCCVLIRDGAEWVAVEPLFHWTQVSRVSFPDDDPVSWFTQSGLVAVRTVAVEPERRIAPIRPYTCVEAVKRSLGLHDPWIWTPWQLYRAIVDRR